CQRPSPWPPPCWGRPTRGVCPTSTAPCWVGRWWSRSPTGCGSGPGTAAGWPSSGRSATCRPRGRPVRATSRCRCTSTSPSPTSSRPWRPPRGSVPRSPTTSHRPTCACCSTPPGTRSASSARAAP
ncbi:MAG: hypothetical protein AVDCRST_MAG06-2529, partial [uncultured Nocardioides sp.]